MSFEPVRSDTGQPCIKCSCGDCGKTEVVPAIHGKTGHDGEGQAVKKLQQRSWTYIGKRLRCPTCEAKRKVVNMQDRKKVKQEPAMVTPAREPTRADKRQIMDLLEDVYDTDLERYRHGDTDDTVADVLNVLPGWVAAIREDFFGPDGGNQEIADLDARLSELVAPMEAASEKASAAAAELGKLRVETAEIRKKLEAIKVAVGPRNLLKAGIK